MEQQKNHPKHTPMHLFAIRIWNEKLEDGINEWRGRLQVVSKEEGYYFRGWQGLVELLQALVSENNQEDQ